MAASGYTPIQIYHSTTASAAPTAGNLVNGELAINILDGKLYYKDNGGTVQVIASKGTGTIGGSTTQVQYNNAGALAGSANFTFNGTTATINTLNLTNALGAAYGGTAQSTYAQGDLLYASAANTLAKLPIGISTYILTSNGSIPGWSIPSSVVIGTATNLAGGAAGSVPYQSGASTTAFLSIGTVNQVITSTGSAPQWSSALTLTGLSNSGLTTLDKTVTVGNTSFNGAAVFAPSTPAKVYLGTGTVTDVTSAIAATNAAGAIVALGVTPIAATNANVTYTNASTLYIAGAPSAGTNITITNPYALYVAAGDAYFGGTVTAGTVNLTTLDLTNLEVTNIKAKDGTASMTLADSTGVVTFSANPVLNAGTANGVPYLSSPGKVLTTGSALTFDGTNLVNTSSSVGTPEIAIANSATSAGANARLRIKTGGSGSTTYGDAFIQFTDSLNWNWSIGAGSSTSNNLTFNQYFGLTSNELMRLTSTGLGIGTNNPAYKLDVNGNVNIGSTSSVDTALFVKSSTVTGLVGAQSNYSAWSSGGLTTAMNIGTTTNNGISFGTNNIGRLNLDSSGNLGLGVTPSAWGAGIKALQIGTGASLINAGVSGDAYLGQNVFFNGTNNLYINTQLAGQYAIASGVHTWYNAPSGTANSASVTNTRSYTVVALGSSTLAQWQAFFNDSSNNPLTVTPTLGQVLTGNATGTLLGGGLVTQNISFTQAMTLDASGNLLVGGTSNAVGARAILENVTGNQIGLRYTSVATYYNSVDSSGNLIWTKDGTERARITSGGYFKASDNGTYFGSTGTYHEFNQSALADSTIARASNASYASSVLVARALRSQNSAYNLIYCDSGDGADAEFKFTGDGNGYADGTFNNNGADYAEYFESATGDALTVGATVVLDGNKVREATTDDPVSAIMGVVRPKEPSKASMVIGNTAWNKWANKYLTDDFDRYIMEDHEVVEWTDADGKQHSYESHNMPVDVTAPADAVRKTHDDKGNKFQHYKLNPAWNSDAEYTPREKRPEWNIIGLVGQVKVLKGKPVNDRWIKMRDVSASVEEWMIR